jgi:hypothetical protein
LPRGYQAAIGRDRAVSNSTLVLPLSSSFPRTNLLRRNNRNWRWHKKLQFWLTKDDIMIPQVLSAGHECGYYIIWDTVHWRKERV